MPSKLNYVSDAMHNLSTDLDGSQRQWNQMKLLDSTLEAINDSNSDFCLYCFLRAKTGIIIEHFDGPFIFIADGRPKELRSTTYKIDKALGEYINA